MNLINELPNHYCQIDYLNKLFRCLEKKLPKNLDFYIFNPDFSPKILENNNIKIAIHIGNEVGFDTTNYDKVDLIFRFYQSEKCDYKKIFPINTGYNSSGNNEVLFVSEKNIDERTIDVFFKGQKTHRDYFFNSLKLNKYNYNCVGSD
jgi:hypothetical protein